MHRFFARSPRTVANELVGKAIRIGDRQATIMAAKPQTPQDNAQWIGRRPLFTAKPVDVYVVPYRGTNLLFLRTGQTNTCVRIDGISLDGRVFSGPGKVCKALGIKGETTGKFSFDGRVVDVMLGVSS